jgi:Protein of unknown function (DUF1565)
MDFHLSQRACRAAAAALLTLLLGACGGGGGGTTQPPPSGNVTGAGATVTSQDGQALLSVPQGAVSAPVTVSLASASDAGYEADPQVLRSTVYQLNVSTPTSLEQPATLSVQFAQGAPLPAHHTSAALSMRGRSSNLLVQLGLLGCDSAVDPSANPAAGVTCVYDATLWPTCPSDVPLSFGLESAYYAPAYFTATPGNTGPVIFCQAAPESQPQLALLSATAKAAVLPTAFSTSTRKASTSLGALATALYGLLLDVTSPAVQHLNAVVIPIDSGTSKLQLTADATDNVAINELSFSQWTVSGNPTNSTVVIAKTTLASLATGPFTFTSAALPNASLYNSHYIATAVDGAGNLAVASVFLTQGRPAIATFTATPASLPIGGGAVTLAWTTVGAATLSIDNGVGDVTALSSKSVNLTASTTFTLTATNALGTVTSQAAVTVVSASDRYVDVANGLDTNACTQAAPCKSMTKALASAPSGATVYLADGLYAPATQGGSVSIPDGVTLRAVNPGSASVVLPLTAAGSASLDGIALAEGASCGSITAASTTGAPTLTLTGVSITCLGTVTIGGSVKATMAPGTLAGGVYTGPVPDGFGAIIGLTGTAQLLIQGGIIDGNHLGQPAFGGALIYHLGNGSLTLDGVTVRNRGGSGLVASGTASIVLENGTLLDNLGTPGDCPTGSAVVVSGTNTVTLDHSQMSNLPASGICVRNGSSLATINILQSTISNALTAAINAEIGSGSTAAVTVIGSSLTNNNIGIDTGFVTASTFDIESSTITGNSIGVEMTGGSLKMRNSNVSNNSSTGLAFFDTVTVDLGTTASPGGNTITGNTTVGLQHQANNNIEAVGNTWNANQQGADANGHYSTAPNYTPVPELGPKNGTNFNIVAAFTLDL